MACVAHKAVFPPGFTEPVCPPRLESLSNPRTGPSRTPRYMTMEGHTTVLPYQRGPFSPSALGGPSRAPGAPLNTCPCHRGHNPWGGSAPQMRLKPVGGEVGLRTPSPPPALTPPPPHHAWHLSYVPGKRERSQEELSRTTEMSRLLLEGPPKGQGASRPLAPRPTLALEPAPQSFWKGPCLPPGEFRESF